MSNKAAYILTQSALPILFVLICLGDANLFAQGFDLDGYLRKKDVNGNGKVEPAEMSANTKRIINDSGLNAAKSYKIDTIVKFYNKKNGIKGKEQGTKTTSKSTDRKVSGFGVEKSDDVASSPFGSMGADSKASEKITKNADGIMNRYDRNKNGMLDADEMRKIPWGSPDPKLSDLNKDGRMSRTELIRRLAAKENQSSSSRTSSRSSSSSRDEQRRKEDAERRSRERDKYKSSGRTSSSPSSSSSSSRSKPTASRSSSTTKSEPKKIDRARYEKYAASVIASYDKDKDGKLSKEEFDKIRRPPANADADKDGFVTKTEYFDSLVGANSTSSTSSATASKSEPKKSTKSSYGSSRRSSSRSGSFEDLDANKDQQVQMHEYSSEWNDETVEAFYKIDRNGDGIITMIEWSARSK